MTEHLLFSIGGARRLVSEAYLLEEWHIFRDWKIYHSFNHTQLVQDWISEKEKEKKKKKGA